MIEKFAAPCRIYENERRIGRNRHNFRVAGVALALHLRFGLV